jgi:hypothetical protein
MKSVIYIDNPQNKEEKPVEFTHVYNSIQGWSVFLNSPTDYEKVVYLGHCSSDGDMFAAYGSGGLIMIYTGHLNSGKYE